MFKKDQEYYDTFNFFVKGKEVGYLCCDFGRETYSGEVNEPTTIYIHGVNIDPKYQGKKYGKKMMNEIIHYLKATYPEYTKYALDTWIENIPAYKSYLNAGFKVVGEPDVVFLDHRKHYIHMIYER